MDLLTHYDYLVAARRPILDRVRALTPEQYRQSFPFGLGTVRRTMHHLAGAEWFLIGQIRGGPAGEYPFGAEAVPDAQTLERLWRGLEPQTRATLETERDWARAIEYVVTIPSRRRYRIHSTALGVFTQWCYHEVHHRAQVMAMLRQLGASVETIDFIWMTGAPVEEP
jgi:uncharacterized damage-inducible protein DinB